MVGVVRRGAVLAGVLLVAAGCGGSPTSSRRGSATDDATPSTTSTQVRFAAPGGTVHGTLLRPRGSAEVPAVLLIAGSGPTDRNGDASGEQVGTLRTLATWLADDGVATLRYDKLGSGETGLGSYASRLQSIGTGVFEGEADAALRFLAAQRGVDPRRLGVVGHSEGALYALLAARRDDPPVAAVGLLEPLGIRFLDVVTRQVDQQSRSSSPATARRLRADTRRAVASLRRNGTVPDDLGGGLQSLFTPATARYLHEVDRYDPAVVARGLPASTRVLVSCSTADIQVSCSDVDHLETGLRPARTTRITLRGVDHVLKEDRSRTGAHYGADLPFSSQLRTALRAWVRRALG